jgi:hypothetical protein
LSVVSRGHLDIRLTGRFEGVLRIIKLVEKNGQATGGHEVSTLPAIDEAAAPPAIAQILDEGATTEPLGFVNPQTADLSTSSVTIRPAQRREHVQAGGRQLSEKDAGLVGREGNLCVEPIGRATFWFVRSV